MIKKLILTIVLLMLTAASSARTVDTCSSSDDPLKRKVLREALGNEKIPFYVDGNLVCVSSEYRNQFVGVTLKLFPPDPSKKVKVPSSPTGAPMNSVKLVEPSEQRRLEAELRKRHISFTTDKTGKIWYEAAREKEIEEIEYRIFEEPQTHER